METTPWSGALAYSHRPTAQPSRDQDPLDEAGGDAVDQLGSGTETALYGTVETGVGEDEKPLLAPTTTKQS